MTSTVLEKEKCHQNLEFVISRSKETHLNGHVVENFDESEGEICPLCGKSFQFQEAQGRTTLNDELYNDESVCQECFLSGGENVNPHYMLEYVDRENDESRRDSGFHTFKRDSREFLLSHTYSQGSGDEITNSTYNSEHTSYLYDKPASDNEEDPVFTIMVPDIKNSDLIKNEKNHPKKVTDDKMESAETLGSKLFHYEGYSRNDIAKHLYKNTDYSRKVAKEFLKFFEFTNLSLVDGYRKFLMHFALLGETQERERLLLYFSEHYADCNPDFLNGDADAVHTLICASTLLNTDLHGNVGLNHSRKKMSFKQFTCNLSGLNTNQSDYPKDLLDSVYHSVKKKPLPWGGQEITKHSSKVQRSISMRPVVVKQPSDSSAAVITVKRTRSLRTPTKPKSSGGGRSAKLNSLSKSSGLLWRKVLLDTEGKKVSLNKRGWKVYSANLHNLELLIVKRGSTEAKTLSLHHSLATESENDTKRKHAFRLVLANHSITLYQADSDEKMKQWINDINKAAALLSAAPLCSPIGSQLIFRRPLLPSAPSTLPLQNQYEKIQKLLEEHRQDLSATKEESRKSQLKPEHILYYDDKIVYLESQTHKYEVYSKVLEDLLQKSFLSDKCSKSNIGTSTDSGSALSITPSEPPMMSPPPFNGHFIFPDSEDVSSQSSCGESISAYSSPAHLSYVAMSATSSLPNLSPILEGATSAAYNIAPRGSFVRRRQLKGRSFYESTINDACSKRKEEKTVEKEANKNNSNHITLYSSKKGNFMEMRVNRERSDGTIITSTDFPLQQIKIPIISQQMREENVSRLHNGQSFEVERYHMHVADMATIARNHTDKSVRDREVIPDILESSTNIPPPPLFENHELTNPVSKHPLVLARVKGRKERRGIERHSYMQAISYPE